MKCVSPNENCGCFHICGDIITLTSIGTFQLPETSDLAPESSDMKRLLNPKVLVTCGTLRYVIKFDVSIQKMLHISRKNSFQPVMSHDQSIEFQLFPGTFQWNARKTCVPLTSQLEFQEFLSKRKAPHITFKRKVSRFCASSEFLFLFILLRNQTMRGE